MTFPFDGNCIHPRTKQNKNGVFCLACHQIIVEPKQFIKKMEAREIQMGRLMNTTLCDQCGAWVTPDIDKCPKCGYQLIECCQGQPPADPSDDKNEDPPN